MKITKRKVLLGCWVALGALALLFLLLIPAAPLLARLGVEPFCIQGDFPRLQVVPCPSSRLASAAVTPLPTLSGQAPVPIIVDDDGSPDGVIALLYFLSDPRFDVKAVTVSCGEAHPRVFAGHVLQLLAGLGRGDIPVGAGRETPLEGSNAFPEPWRQASDDFWGVALPQAEGTASAVPAADLILQTIAQSPQPVLVFASGNLTNVAEALRLDPGIAGNIHSIHIMGGSLYRDGNIKSAWPEIDNRAAEWNIWVDPLAAQEVFSAGPTVYVTPLDATDKIDWTRADADAWDAGSPAGALAADLLEARLRAWGTDSLYIWDLVAAVNTADARFCPEVPLAVAVNLAPGPEQGRTAVTGGTPNAVACLEPDAGQIKASVAAVLGR